MSYIAYGKLNGVLEEIIGLPGPKGDKGDKGDQGPQGIPGDATKIEAGSYILVDNTSTPGVAVVSLDKYVLDSLYESVDDALSHLSFLGEYWSPATNFPQSRIVHDINNPGYYYLSINNDNIGNVLPAITSQGNDYWVNLNSRAGTVFSAPSSNDMYLTGTTESIDGHFVLFKNQNVRIMDSILYDSRGKVASDEDLTSTTTLANNNKIMIDDIESRLESGEFNTKISENVANTIVDQNGLYSPEEVVYFDHSPTPDEINAVPEGAIVIEPYETGGGTTTPPQTSVSTIQLPYKENYTGSNIFTLPKNPTFILDIYILEGLQGVYQLQDGDYEINGNTVTILNPTLTTDMRVKIEYSAY